VTNESLDLSEDELELILSRCFATRPGPWKSFVEGRDHYAGSDFIKVGDNNNRSDDIELTGATTEDQDFIANAKQDVPRLVSEILRLRSILAAKD